MNGCVQGNLFSAKKSFASKNSLREDRNTRVCQVIINSGKFYFLKKYSIP